MFWISVSVSVTFYPNLLRIYYRWLGKINITAIFHPKYIYLFLIIKYLAPLYCKLYILYIHTQKKFYKHLISLLQVYREWWQQCKPWRQWTASRAAVSSKWPSLHSHITPRCHDDDDDFNLKKCIFWDILYLWYSVTECPKNL